MAEAVPGPVLVLEVLPVGASAGPQVAEVKPLVTVSALVLVMMVEVPLVTASEPEQPRRDHPAVGRCR